MSRMSDAINKNIKIISDSPNDKPDIVSKFIKNPV